MAVGPTPSAAYRSRLAALSEGHAQWVDRELPGARFDAAGRRAKSDYNQHYVDLEADDDAFHAAARAALGLSSLVEATRSRHVLDDGICVTCQPHELVDGECVPCGTVASRNFNINEPREPHSGKWTAGPGGAVKDVLKLAGKLGKDEHLVASNKVKFRDGNIFMATTEVGGERHLRFGLPEFDESSGEALPWRPNGPHTANLDQRGTETLRQGFDELDQMGREHVKKAKAIADRMDAAPKGSPDYKAAQQAWFQIAGAGQLIGEGSAHDQNGAAVVFKMTMDQEPSVQIAVRPADAPDNWDFDEAVQNGDGGLDLSITEFRRLRGQLDAIAEVG